jgi:PTH1 family peptidyl-tRNA hydrolase
LVAVVGLGNPGPRYAATRHNLGFRVVDRLVERRRATRVAHDALHEAWRVGRGGLLLVKPLTFMNASGEAVARLCAMERIEPASLLVVCDDVNLPLGRLRVRGGGSDGGHNGLFSVGDELGTLAFPRLRLGVGPKPPEHSLSDFVLADFGEAEVEAVETMVDRACDAALLFAARGLDAAMREFNAVAAESEPEGKGVREEK